MTEVLIESTTKPENPKKGIKYNDAWHTVVGKAANYVNDLKQGDLVEVKEGDNGAVTFIQKKTELGEPKKEPDRFTPTGDLYAMCEEKLNGIVEQNMFIQKQNENLVSLLMEVAVKLQIDINKFKPASEV